MSREMQIDYCRWYHPDLVPKRDYQEYWLLMLRRTHACFCMWSEKESCFVRPILNRGWELIAIDEIRLVMVLPPNDQFYPTLEP